MGERHKLTSSALKAVKQQAIELLQPQQDIEYQFLENDSFLIGLDWGIPRYGHPEGKIIYHIKEVLENVSNIEGISDLDRNRLRIITFVHDTFKYLEDRGRPRNWSRHHSMLARDFVAHYTSDKQILEIVALHDEAYYIWRMIELYKEPKNGAIRLAKLLERINSCMQLYYLFFKCDTKTGDKVQAPLIWFERTFKDIQVIGF